MELRPLGFGEIFDRSVTLYIRNFVPFAAIVAVLIVPLAILQYVIDLAAQPQFDVMLHQIQHPGSLPSSPIPTFFDSPWIILVVLVMMLMAYIMWPFALNAVAVGVARLYRGRRVEFRQCYEVALRRWPQILGMIGIDVLVLSGWYGAFFAVAMIVVFLAIALGALSSALGIWFGVIFGIIAVLAVIPVLAPLVVALSFAMYAAVIEERPAIASLVLGFARVFNRAEFWRSVLFSVAAFAVLAGGSAVVSVVGILAAFAHLPILEAGIDALARLIVAPFGAVLIAVYYFDVRIRREAYDLEASLERLAAIEPA